MTNIDIQEQVDSSGSYIKEKRKKSFFITLILGIFIGFSLTAMLYSLPQDKSKKIAMEPTNATKTTEPKTENIFEEFRKYSSLRLKSYSNIENGSVSEGMSYDIEGSEKQLIPGIVTYRLKSLDGNSSYIHILDKINVKEDYQEVFFNEAYEDIKNKNSNATWIGGKPWALETTIAGTPGTSFLTEIKNVSYPKTDYVFSTLSLTHGHAIATADEESINFIISIFAIKDNIIIEIETYGNLIKDLGLSQEDHLKCSEMTGPNENTDWLTYNVKCLSDLYSSGKYDEQLAKKTQEMVLEFEIE